MAPFAAPLDIYGWSAHIMGIGLLKKPENGNPLILSLSKDCGFPPFTLRQAQCERLFFGVFYRPAIVC